MDILNLTHDVRVTVTAMIVDTQALKILPCFRYCLSLSMNKSWTLCKSKEKSLQATSQKESPFHQKHTEYPYFCKTQMDVRTILWSSTFKLKQLCGIVAAIAIFIFLFLW